MLKIVRASAEPAGLDFCQSPLRLYSYFQSLHESQTQLETD